MITNYTNIKCNHDVGKSGRKRNSWVYKPRSVLGFKAQKLNNRSLGFKEHCLHIFVGTKFCVVVSESMVDNLRMKFMLDSKEHCQFQRCKIQNYEI